MGTSLNILLVEDSDLEADMLKRGLKKINASGDLVRAKDGQEALDMLTGGLADGKIAHPFFVLLDINMPRMNGHEFLAALRENPDVADTRVIVFTTSDNPKDIRLAYGKNAAGYVVKPDNGVELRTALERIGNFWHLCAHPPRFAHQSNLGKN